MGHTQCVSVLLNMGVTPNPLDMEGGTPLDYAKQTGHKGTTLLPVFPVIVQGSHSLQAYLSHRVIFVDINDKN